MHGTVSHHRLQPAKAELIRANPPRVLTVMEGAAYLTISPRKLRYLIQGRRIKFARIGARIVIKREWLDDFIAPSA